MDCQGLALEWEQDAEMRQRVRAEGKMLTYPAGQRILEANRPNALENSFVLLPVLKRLASHPIWRLPHLEPLKMEVAIFGNKMGQAFGEKLVYQTAIELKKLVGFIKRRVKRKEVTKDWVSGKVNGAHALATSCSLCLTCVRTVCVNQRVA